MEDIHYRLNEVTNVGLSYELPNSLFQIRMRHLNKEVKYVESEMLHIKVK